MKPTHDHCTQVAVNGNLVVPDHKPKIERILRVTTTPALTKIVVINKKVIFAGHILIFVEYVACVPGDSQPVHFVSFKVPFADFIEHPCAKQGMKAKLDVSVEFQEFHTITHRCITKLVILKICVVKLEEKPCDPAPHPCPAHRITQKYAGDPEATETCGRNYPPDPHLPDHDHQQVSTCPICGKPLNNTNNG